MRTETRTERLIAISEVTRGLVASMRTEGVHSITSDVPTDSIAVIRDVAKIDGWTASFTDTSDGWSRAVIVRKD